MSSLKEWFKDLLSKKKEGHTFGKYPVPPGTLCEACDEPANGSVAGKDRRIYLCLGHMKIIDDYIQSVRQNDQDG